ncbi:hypothetical protein ACP70R_049575 [Stipagrostis hirtigluma subsp. patula]
MSSSSSEPSSIVPWRLSNAWRSFTAFRAREVTGTHLLVIDGYSAVDRTSRHGEAIESGRFRVGGSSWKLSYYPSGYKDSKDDGHVAVALTLMDNRLLGHAAGATASFKVSILDRDGNPAYSQRFGTDRYSIFGIRTYWCDVPVTAEQWEAALRLREDDKLVVRCDVTVHRCDKESRIKWYLRQLLD